MENQQESQPDSDRSELIHYDIAVPMETMILVKFYCLKELEFWKLTI
jgi:hypothetical protein